MNKILVAIITRNNHVMLQHFLDSIKKYDAGYPYDVVILDNSSDDKKHLETLNKAALNRHKIMSYPNDRVEATYERFRLDYVKHNFQYRGVLFCHDDSCVIRDNWLKVYIDRLESNFLEPHCKETPLKDIPIGRIGACHQHYRSYTQMMGYNLRCEFVEGYIELAYGKPSYEVMPIAGFKYSDPERIFFTHDCLVQVPMITLKHFYEMPEEERIKYEEMLNKYLPYADEGIAPRDKYPAGKSWNKLTMLTEFLNSVEPLIHGFRTVGLEGNGFLEQIDGFDKPWGQSYIAHWGSPNMKRFLAGKFNTTPEEIHKMLYSKNRMHLMNFEKITKATIINDN